MSAFNSDHILTSHPRARFLPLRCPVLDTGPSPRCPLSTPTASSLPIPERASTPFDAPRATAVPSPRFIRGPAPSRSPPLRCPVLRHGAQTSMFEPSTNRILTSHPRARFLTLPIPPHLAPPQSPIHSGTRPLPLRCPVLDTGPRPQCSLSAPSPSSSPTFAHGSVNSETSNQPQDRLYRTFVPTMNQKTCGRRGGGTKCRFP